MRATLPTRPLGRRLQPATAYNDGRDDVGSTAVEVFAELLRSLAAARHYGSALVGGARGAVGQVGTAAAKSVSRSNRAISAFPVFGKKAAVVIGHHHRVGRLLVADGATCAFHGRGAVLVAEAAKVVLVDSGEDHGQEDDRDDCHDELNDAGNEKQHTGAEELATPLARRLRGTAHENARANAREESTDRADRAGPATPEADHRKDGAAQGVSLVMPDTSAQGVWLGVAGAVLTRQSRR